MLNYLIYFPSYKIVFEAEQSIVKQTQQAVAKGHKNVQAAVKKINAKHLSRFQAGAMSNAAKNNNGKFSCFYLVSELSFIFHL